MKKLDLSIAGENIVLVSVFLVLFVVGYSILHQVVELLTAGQENNLNIHGFIKH